MNGHIDFTSEESAAMFDAICALRQLAPTPSLPKYAQAMRQGSAKAELIARYLRACRAAAAKRHTAGELAEIEADQARRIRGMK